MLGLADVVNFAGSLPEPDLESAIQGAVAVVMPSVAGEVFGLVAAETMIRRRLIIVPGEGSLAEVVGDGGLKFKAGDAESLADCMDRVLTEPQWAVELAERSWHRALEAFPEERMIDEHLNLYSDLIQ